MEEIAKFRFEWRGAQFTWTTTTHSPDRFESDRSDLPWTANVEPEGLAWNAEILFAGGSMKGVGITPQNALDAARQCWVNETTKAFG